MITNIKIKNFKSLEDIDVKCSNLNVLTGLNGMGKSSVIQALLLLRQSHEKGMLQNDGLSLRGDLVQIGTVKEALYDFSTSKDGKITFDIEFNADQKSKSWNFAKTTLQQEDKDSDYMRFSTNPNEEIPEYYQDYSLFKNNTFKYLNADRWVKNEYETSDFNVIRNRFLGKHGEFTTHYLIHFENEEINSELIFPNGSGINQLGIQVSEWMTEISPNIKVKAEKIKGVNSVKLRYIFEGNDLSTNEIMPLNVGFGITYVLPVIVALLSAKKGELLIIENPESHIHPKGQSLIGRLMAKVAETGVQIFVETHSDHIMNGILVSLYLQNKGLEKGIVLDNLKINFFRRMKDSLSSELIPINIKENGRVVGIPDDFFDQYAKDMETIIGF